MKKRLTIMVIALLVVFGGILLFNTVKSIMIKRFFAHYKPPAVTVSSAEAKAVNWKPKISAVGNFIAINGVEVNSEASGKIITINFDSGQYVEKNSPLIIIDDSVDQAKLKFEQAQLTLKEINYKRQADLSKRGAAPVSNVDEAKANLQQAQANVEQIQAQINHKHIVAPFSGRLGIRKVNLGEFVSPGQTSIVSLQSLDPLYLEFYLPEQLYKRIKLNQKILFSVEAFPHTLFEGKVSAINSKVDVNTHNMLIQATLPNCSPEAINSPEQTPLATSHKEALGDKLVFTCNSELNAKNKIKNYAFIPGMFASINISQPAKPDTVIIPSTSIAYSLYGNSVYIIKKEKQDNQKDEILTVQRVFVQTGAQQGNYTVIKKGIKAGDLVVSTGDLKLQNGTPVVINNSVPLNSEVDLNTLGE